jgi:sugar O-acyltransferase (sialic acid O-acetyltransferase NeuD family)
LVKVVIAGTGYPEIAYWMEESRTTAGEKIDLLGFLDDNKSNATRGLNGYSVIGGFSCISSLSSEIKVINSIARTMPLRNETTQLLARYGAVFTSIIHDTALTRNNAIGQGSIIGPYVVLEAGVTIGEHCCILAGTTIGHDTRIGNYCFAGHGTHVQGHVQVSDEVFLGSGSNILPGVSIGKSATIGINSTVIQNVLEAKSVSAPISRIVR